MESLDHLVGGLTSELDSRLATVDALLAARYPGERAGRQPVHTVYVPADRFHPDAGDDASSTIYNTGDLPFAASMYRWRVGEAPQTGKPPHGRTDA